MRKKPKGNIFYSQMVDCGLHRKENQDAVYSYTKGDFGLFVLADGMGGHSKGELASNEITKTCEEYVKSLQKKEKTADFLTLTREVAGVLRTANERVLNKYSKDLICGSTVVVLLVKKDCYAVFSAGDSRVYTFYQGEMEVLTIDDIWDNLPGTLEKYTRQQIYEDSRRGKLVQAIGVAKEVNIHIVTNRIRKGQCFLLCSDGVYRFCSEQILQEGMKHSFSETMVQSVLERYKKEVYQNGAKDNLSAILVCVR